MKLKYHCERLLLVAFLVAWNLIIFAQPPGSPPTGSPPGGPPPGGGGSAGSNPPCWDPECIPIDGGVGFLIAAGAAFGIRKIYNQKGRSRA